MNPSNGGKTPREMAQTIKHCMRVMDRQASGPRVPVWMQATLVSAGIVFGGACTESEKIPSNGPGQTEMSSSREEPSEVPEPSSETATPSPNPGKDPVVGVPSSVAPDPPEPESTTDTDPNAPDVTREPPVEKPVDPAPMKKTDPFGNPGEATALVSSIPPGPTGAYGAPPTTVYGGPPMGSQDTQSVSSALSFESVPGYPKGVADPLRAQMRRFVYRIQSCVRVLHRRNESLPSGHLVLEVIVQNGKFQAVVLNQAESDIPAQTITQVRQCIHSTLGSFRNIPVDEKSGHFSGKWTPKIIWKTPAK